MCLFFAQNATVCIEIATGGSMDYRIGFRYSRDIHLQKKVHTVLFFCAWKGKLYMKKMNVAAVTGFILCLFMILIGIATNGGIGTLGGFIHGASMLITFGGTFCAAMITTDSFRDYIDGLRSFTVAFHGIEMTADGIMQQILSLSDISRKEGLLALEETAEKMDESILKKGLTLILDGSAPELVKDILEIDMIHQLERNSKRIRFWQDLGSYAPAWGMVGTLIGLINMLKSMSDPSSVGEGMSTALITTLYGSVMANWVCIPISRKLEENSKQEEVLMEMAIEGVLSIQMGENSHIIQEKLNAFREAKKADEEG